MIKGLMITPPVVGRISIGKLVERNGKWLPEKDDEFTITSQVQTRSGWALHPLDHVLRSTALTQGTSSNASTLSLGSSLNSPLSEEPSFESHTPPTLQSKLKRKLQIRIDSSAAADSDNEQAKQELASHDPNGPQAPQNAKAPVPQVKNKLRSLPVRMLFNDPHLNLRASYTLFDRSTARPLCVGDGHQCRRLGPEGVKTLPCVGPDHCPLAAGGHCKLLGRLNVRIDHPDNHSDELSSFVLRSTGVNTVRTLMARMQYLQALSGDLLSYLPLELRIRGKSTTQSHRTPIYYVDLCLRQDMPMEVAVLQAKGLQRQSCDAGLHHSALEAAARDGFAQGEFEEVSEDIDIVASEFFPSQDPEDYASPNDKSSMYNLASVQSLREEPGHQNEARRRASKVDRSASSEQHG